MQNNPHTDDAHTWPDRAALAAQLSAELGRPINRKNVADWKELGCPIPSSGPIDKYVVYRWLLVEKRQPGKPGKGSASLRDQKLQAEIEKLHVAIARLRGQTIPADEASAAVIAAATEIRTALREDFPLRCIELARESSTDDARDAIQRWVDEKLSGLALLGEKFAAAASAAITTPGPQPAAADEPSEVADE